MLHKKRTYGLLYGKIVDKSEKDKLNDTRIYPNENTDNTTILNYNYHTLKLNFSYLNTSNCEDGCYLLVTFEQKKANGHFPLIGYEFTILTRFWNYTDYISNIVDIPFNEYLIGCFEKGSITHHYYSLNVPEDAEKIIIQIEGNYLDGYYGEGRLKINTMKKTENTEKLDIINKQNLLTLNLTLLKLKEKIISLAFRPKDYFDDIFSFYYFRVLYLKEDETIYYPIDSNLGNLCKPEQNIEKKFYYCHFIFKNDFNELSRNFTIASAIQNEYYIIYAQMFKNNKKCKDDSKKFVYNILNMREDIDYFLFTFEFQNGELKNIISTISDNVTDFYPQIYSYQMFSIDNSTKINHFQMISNYTVYYQYILGSGTLKINFLVYQSFSSNRNFKGKPLSVTINSTTDKITCTAKSKYVYFMKLQYNMKNKEIEEIQSGTTFSQFIIGRNFPLYFYLKVKNKNYINIDINLRVNSYISTMLQNSFQIKGYVLDKDTIQRKINGEYIKLNEPIFGYYSNIFKVGLLQINKNIDNNKDHILIEIKNDNKKYIDSYLLVELVTKEKNHNPYFLPINQYVIETFDGENGEILKENKYYLSSEEKGTIDQALIEISSPYSDIRIKFNESSKVNSSFYYFTGFNRYRVISAYNDDVYFSVINTADRKNTSYMIRYYYTGSEYKYLLDDLDKQVNITFLNNEYANVSITYSSIKIVKGSAEREVKRDDIYFYIYAFLFKKDGVSKELINTTAILNERKASYQTNTIHHYNYSNKEKWKITFENIARNKSESVIYELQLQVNAILLNNIFNEEFLIFTSEIDLTDIKDKRYIIWIIVVVVVVALIAGLVIIFVIKYKRLKKNNINLEESLKSLAFTNEVQKNVINEEQIMSQKESDYENTFI